MSKPRGCKFFTHVQCEYNRCRGREISAGHVTDCPFQDTDEADQDDEVEISENEDDNDGWKPGQGIQHKPTPATAHIHPLSNPDPSTQSPAPQAPTSHYPRVHRRSGATVRTSYTSSIISKRSMLAASTPSVALRYWAQAPAPPTHITIRHVTDHNR